MSGMGFRNKIMLLAALAAAVGAALSILGCSESTYIGTVASNRAPTVELTNGPFERSMVGYQVKFSWIGNDDDGVVRFYEFVVCDGDPLGFDHDDTTGADKWHRTLRTDSLFKFTADEFDTNFSSGGTSYSRLKRTHTFFVRAVDDRNGRSEAAYRSFTAFTFAPYVVINLPVNPFPGQAQTLPPITTFRWTGVDPIDNMNNTQDVDSIRYLLTPNSMSTLGQLNEHPELFERQWSPWFAYDAPGDSGRSTTIGDDEVLNRLNSYLLAVQAKDEAGAVTSVYSLRNNARAFAVLPVAGPILRVREPYLGIMTVQGTKNRVQTFSLPAGFVLRFGWTADASGYGGVIVSYRYGWDVVDLNDPNAWDVYPSQYVTTAPARTLVAGIHTFYVEAVDNNGMSSLAQIEIETFPIDMSRNLLWVDDFYSTDDFDQKNYGFPTESQHDAFWLNICSRADGFQSGRDVYDTKDFGMRPPDMRIVWQYKNVIWTYSSEDRVNAWDDVVRFIPESMVGNVFPLPFNYLAYFLTSGGHIWTSGRSDRQGGLCAVLYPMAQAFPLSLKCEITGPRNACTGDTSGVRSMAYRDYCVSVLDKVMTPPRDDPDMPVRRVDWDAMSWAFKDTTDLLTKARPGIPRRLILWEEVTKTGRFFDPMVQGFTYVEVYNPAYWMPRAGASAQSCFHPIYRARTRNTHSVINNQVVAFWTTKYANVAAPVAGAKAAPSVHFGLPLWFFNRAQVDSISDVVFDEWGIGAAH